MQNLTKIYLQSIWFAPLVTFFIFILEAFSVFYHMFALQNILSIGWELAVIGQIVVVFYQLMTKQFIKGVLSCCFLGVPVLCWFFWASQ